MRQQNGSLRRTSLTRMALAVERNETARQKQAEREAHPSVEI
jgi:hypothetical protein